MTLIHFRSATPSFWYTGPHLHSKLVPRFYMLISWTAPLNVSLAVGSNFAGFFNIFAPDSLKNSVVCGGESVKNQLSEESYSLHCSNLLKILKFVRNAFFQPMLCFNWQFFLQLSKDLVMTSCNCDKGIQCNARCPNNIVMFFSNHMHVTIILLS